MSEWTPGGGEEQLFRVTYEIPPLRAIYVKYVQAMNVPDAVSRFMANHPRAKIIKVEA